MKTSRLFVGALAFSVLLGACSPAGRAPASTPGINERFVAPDLDPAEWASRWEVESREIYAGRQEIVAALGLAAGERVADVGTGTGLFVGLFSRAVGSAGKVFAVDISPRFVEFVARRAEEQGLANVETVLSREDSTELATASVDVVFLCDTYHHFERRVEMLRSIRDALRPGSRLVVVDFERIPGTSRPWVLDHVRAGKEQVVEEIVAAGFVFEGEAPIEGLRENYLLRFSRP